MVKINTFYVTYLNEPEPILTYEKNDGLNIDLHLQLIALEMKAYTIRFKITNSDGVELLSFNGTVDPTQLFDKQENSNNEAIASIAFFVKMSQEELLGSSRLNFNATIENEVSDVSIFMMKKEDNHG